jgi:polyphosphate kinase 2 (PPK2 family)
VREFERMLHDEGTTVRKVFLHLSREEQRRRLEARRDDPEKRWKFRLEDLDTRTRWDETMAAYETAISATSTADAPWYVVPADRKWASALAVATLMVTTMEALDPQFPTAEQGIDEAVIE